MREPEHWVPMKAGGDDAGISGEGGCDCWGGVLKGDGGAGCDHTFIKGRRHMYAAEGQTAPWRAPNP